MSGFNERQEKDLEYWRQGKFIRGEQHDVYAMDGLAILSMVGLCIVAAVVVGISKLLGSDEPGLLGGIITVVLFTCLFGKTILRILNKIGD